MADNEMQRVPPQSIEAEESVLGAMLLDNRAVSKVIEILNEDAFYRENHSIIYGAMIALFSENEPIDQLTVMEKLKKGKKLKSIGGAYYLAELADRSPTAANVQFHAKIVLEKYILRKLIQTAGSIAERAYECREGVTDLLEEAEQDVFKLSESRLRDGFQSITPILHDTFERIEKLHDVEGGVTGVPSGFANLDNLTAGFQRSDLIIIAGRPSMGKTALALTMARNASVEHNVTVGFFSLEMSNYQLSLRLLTAETRVNAHKVRSGKLSKEEWQTLSAGVGRLAEAPIFTDDKAGISILEIRAKARRLKAEHNVGLIIVDYLQLIAPPKGANNREQEISIISRSLKALAKELDIPVVALSQLSREVEKRGKEKRPVLSDLRESGAIEQDADVVMFVYRPEMYGIKVDNDGNSLEGVAEIIIGKQRNGPTGTAKMTFIRDYAKFEQYAEDVYTKDVPF